MNQRSKTSSIHALLFLYLLGFDAINAAASPSDHWVSTWAAAPIALANPARVYGAADTSYREIVHISLGGPRVRIVLSNEFGLDPLTIGATHIALSAGGSDINLASASALTFSGHPSITIPPGALAVSDPADMKVPVFADLAVSLFIPTQPIRQISEHDYANQTSYKVAGNVVSHKTFDSPEKIYSWPFLKGVDVEASDRGATVVAFGDSITDGVHSARDANTRWPDVLARRLQSNKKTAQLGVLNEGIGGNRVLNEGYGPSALARFDRDVLAQAGVKYLIFFEGINDICSAQAPDKPYDAITAADLISGFSQLATRAHTHGIKVIGATITPYGGVSCESPAGEKMREAVNQWIRTSNQLDGVIDFDKATRDPANPDVLSPAVNSPDHIHPGDSGYKLMGNSIDLNLFTTK